MAGRAALGPLFTGDAFRNADFEVDAFMDTLTLPLLNPGAGRVVTTHAGLPPVSGKAHLRQLLEQFTRADRDLVRLQASIDTKTEALQADVTARHRAFEVQVSQLETGFEAQQARFTALDDQMASAAQVATRIGDRLQTAEMFRTRATEAIDMVRFLQDFSRTTDFTELDQVFRQDAHLDRAAAITSRMQTLALELTTAKERAGLGREEAQSVSSKPQPGTIEYAAGKLEEFRQSLETKVVTRFDAAAGRGDYAAMAQCARIMSHFPRGAETLINRYIASRPMFMDVREVMGPEPSDVATEPAGAALHRLNALHKSIATAVGKEAPQMAKIFPNPDAALAAFVTRIFEQRLKVALEGLLVAPGPGAPPEELQQYLQLLAEAYRRTHTLAGKLQPVVGPDCNTTELADVVFAEPLEEYVDLELAWLQQLYETRAPPTGGAISIPLVTDFFAWNREAIERSGAVCPEGERPAAVRALFHSSTVDRASTGCLLEQVATHVIGALAAAVEAARRAAARPFQPTPDMRGPALLNKAAYPVAAEGVGRVLSAVTAAASAIQLLGQHYWGVVEPAVEAAAAEASSCATGLSALTRAVEDRVTASLAAALSYLASQVDRTLMAEQKREDFLPCSEAGLDLERPTDAARLVTALLRAAARVATSSLHGSNLASFLAQMGRQVHSVLTNHMQRFTYSATGALRWKRDMMEYTDWARATVRAPLVDERFQELQAFANILVVAPEALQSLIDGQLRIGHSQALKFIRLREDFSHKLPGGGTLATIFAED